MKIHGYEIYRRTSAVLCMYTKFKHLLIMYNIILLIRRHALLAKLYITVSDVIQSANQEPRDIQKAVASTKTLILPLLFVPKQVAFRNIHFLRRLFFFQSVLVYFSTPITRLSGVIMSQHSVSRGARSLYTRHGISRKFFQFRTQLKTATPSSRSGQTSSNCFFFFFKPFWQTRKYTRVR